MYVFNWLLHRGEAYPAVQHLRCFHYRLHVLLGILYNYNQVLCTCSNDKTLYTFMQVFIPVRGSKSKGQIRSYASVRNGKWELDKVVLELKNRPEKSINILDTHGLN